MPLYMFTGKPKGRTKGRSQTYVWAPPSNSEKHFKPRPFYQAEPPQEFDEPGKELDLDAQVWKTYVRETDLVDGELVDGWNKSMDVILSEYSIDCHPSLHGADGRVVFAALFSAISTAFVIESYKNLKQDPADLSAQTLLAISHTLTTMTNGSHSSGSQSSRENEMDSAPFSATWSAICVNVLWFLSLSLSVAVSLISMLAKEWCLTFMLNRTGPPGLQARRRQQRWDGLLKWRMKEVLMVLPSLIHLSLLLFAVGLCVFLWDVHFGVAIPVLFVTTIAAGAYLACTILPFLDRYCPYGTVISMMVKRLTDMHTRSAHNSKESTQDEITAKALWWMVENCETPRSVDVALQSLAGATKDMPRHLLVEWDMWSRVKHRLGFQVPAGGSQCDGSPAYVANTRALESVVIVKDDEDGLEYGSNIPARRLEVLTLGLQSCIDSLLLRIEKEGALADTTTRRTLQKCTYIVTPIRPGSEENRRIRAFWNNVPDPEELSVEITGCLERHLKREVDLGPTAYALLCASFAFLHCCNPITSLPATGALGGRIISLIQTYNACTKSLQDSFRATPNYSRERLWDDYSLRHKELSFLLGMLRVLYTRDALKSDLGCPQDSALQVGYTDFERALEFIWRFLIATTYSDSTMIDYTVQSTFGGIHLLAEHARYNLSSDDCATLESFVRGGFLSSVYWFSRVLKGSSDRTLLIDCLTGYLSTQPNIEWSALPPQLLGVLQSHLRSWPAHMRCIPTPEIYLFTVKCLCQAKTAEDKKACFALMTSFPFPKVSPRFVQLLSTHQITPLLSNSLENADVVIRAFATSQLWLFSTMSPGLQLTDCTGATLTTLEEGLLTHPLSNGALSKQEMVVEQLETKLASIIEEHRDLLEDELGGFNDSSGHGLYTVAYIYRIFECMLQKRGEPLTKTTQEYLEHVPTVLRGLDSSVYLEGELEE